MRESESSGRQPWPKQAVVWTDVLSRRTGQDDGRLDEPRVGGRQAESPGQRSAAVDSSETHHSAHDVCLSTTGWAGAVVSSVSPKSKSCVRIVGTGDDVWIVRRRRLRLLANRLPSGSRGPRSSRVDGTRGGPVTAITLSHALLDWGSGPVCLST